MKVLYISGTGRSGSTILDQVLGQLDGFFSVGELVNVWERGLVDRRKCGCGVPVPDCPVWGPVLIRAFGQPSSVDPVRAGRLARRRHSLSALIRSTLRRRVGGDEYQELLASLYRALHDQTNCRVIVDSSKSPVYARLLGRVPELDVYVIHLVRDPRATAYSWSRVKPLPDFSDDRSMIRQTALVSARRWLRWQVGIELLWNRRQGRYLLLRYEDFVRNPQASLERILNLVEETPQTLPFVDENAVRLSQTHSVSGNPTRFKTGVVELRHDQEWLDRIRKVDRLSVTALTWPLLLRYRYKLR